jgi:transposase
MDTWLHREHGRPERGAPLVGKVAGRKYARTGIVAALAGKPAVEPCRHEGTMDPRLFEGWSVERLPPALPENPAIVMGNASSHRKGRLAPLAEKAGRSALFLPPHSPELNPIEKFWTRLERRLRKILPWHSSSDDALCSAFEGR